MRFFGHSTELPSGGIFRLKIPMSSSHNLDARQSGRPPGWLELEVGTANPAGSTRRPLLWLFLTCVFFGQLVGSGAWAATSPSTVVITKEPAEIERKTFDPQSPPPEMPPLNPSEAALCEFRFGCETRFEVSMLASSAARTIPGTISSITVITSLQIVVWTPHNSPQKIIAHEEAHRAIAEHYYRDVEVIARRLAQRQIGRAVTVPMRNEKPDVETALGGLQNEIVTEYLNQTARRCKFAQERFDVITDHSRKSTGEEDAMAQAIRDEGSHYATRERAG